MKRMKGLAALICAVLMAVVCLCFAGCDGDEGKSLTGSMTVVVCDNTVSGAEEKKYTVDLSAYTAADPVERVLNDLTETAGLYYEGYRGAYGLYFTAVGYTYTPDGSDYPTTAYQIKEDKSAGKYVYVYTSVAKDADTSIYALSVTYGDMTLKSAAVGVSSMHLEDGAVVYIGASVYTG